MEHFDQEQLHSIPREELETRFLSLQEQFRKLSENLEALTEQIRIANSYRFGKHTEKLSALCDGQYSFFDEPEALSDEKLPEPEIEEVVVHRKKHKGKLQEDVKDLPQEDVPVHSVPEEKLIDFYGEGNYRRLPDEHYYKLRFQPATWMVENHTIEVYVGTDGEHQDEFLRGEHPKHLIPNSIVTPSLGAAIMNVKYVNSAPLYRVEQEFQRNGINISRQTMANWMIYFSRHYLCHMWEHMKKKLLSLHVIQSDETPVQVLNDRSPESDSQRGYMWVNRSGEFYDTPIVLYDYHKSRAHTVPLEFYKDFGGILVTDGLAQYHLVEKIQGKLTSANCWAHARRDFADAVKAMGSKNPDIQKTVAYRALARIGAIYKLEEGLKDLSSEERLRERQKEIAPLVEEYFAWVEKKLSSTLAKGKTGEGLRYSKNQEKYLRVFLTDGDVPIDNSASLSSSYFYPHLLTKAA